MSKLFLTNINLNKNELQNARIQNLASAPGTPVIGQIYYNTTSNGLFVWNGTAWKVLDATLASSIPNTALATDPLARANHTGTQVASTISDFNTAVRTNTLNQMANPTAAVSMNSQKITSLAQPTTAGDAAEYQWTLDQITASAAGLDVKASVRAVKAVAGLAAAPSGLTAFDGVTPVVGNRILVIDSSLTANAFNGIYIAAAGTWTRATDLNTSANYTTAAFTFAEEGTTYGSTQWKATTSGTYTVGTTAVAWAQFGGAAVYVGGAGMTLTGNTFDVGAGTGISVGTDTVAIDTAVVVRKYAVAVGDGTSTSIAVTHSLGTLDVVVGVYTVSGGAEVECDVVHTSTSVVTLTFATAPTAGQYRCVVHA